MSDSARRLALLASGPEPHLASLARPLRAGGRKRERRGETLCGGAFRASARDRRSAARITRGSCARRDRFGAGVAASGPACGLPKEAFVVTPERRRFADAALGGAHQRFATWRLGALDPSPTPHKEIPMRPHLHTARLPTIAASLALSGAAVLLAGT